MRTARSVTGFVALTALSVTGCGPDGPEDVVSDAALELTGTFTLKFQHSAKCVDVSAASTANGAKVQQWTCNNRTHQQWKLVDKGSGNHQIVAVHSDKCLQVPSSTNGAKITQSTCNTTNNQLWKLEATGTTGQYRVRSVLSSRCIDISSSSVSNGVALQQWSCSSNNNQKLNFAAVSTTTTPTTTTCPAWVAGTWYTAGTKVTYNGAAYVAEHDNPGYDPVVSTWYWAPTTCSGTTTPGTTTPDTTTGTGKTAVKTGSVPALYLPWVQQAATTCAFLDAPHIAAQIDLESRWDPNAVSSIGAQGIAQFLPGTWASFGGDADGDGVSSPFDPPDGIIALGKYMCYIVNQFGASATWQNVLWGYNAGPEATKAAGGVAPTEEARFYANEILNNLLPKYQP